MRFFGNTSADRSPHIVSWFSKASFFLFLFFRFFGTSLPFREKITDIQNIATSNPVNQIVFSLLYFLSLFGILTNRNRVLRIVKEEKFLTLFLIWSFFTILWSDAPSVSFKRWVQILGALIIFLSVLMHLKSPDEALKYFVAILSVYIPISLLSVVFVPGAVHANFPAWKGLTIHKNMLGQSSLVSLMIWSFLIKENIDIKIKVIAILYFSFSLVLLIGSRSVTSLLTVCFFFVLLIYLRIEKAIFRPLIGRFFSSVYISAFLISLLFLFIMAPELIGYIFSAFGRDITFTGRIDLWALVFEETKRHLFLGCGFGGFWVADLSGIQYIYEEFPWLPNQSHMGYLDILNETGLVGLSIFTLMIIFYFKNLFKQNQSNLWKWFIIAALVINITESTLFGPHMLTGHLFLFSYIALYVSKLLQH